jgi:spore photoproduct lyase
MSYRIYSDRVIDRIYLTRDAAALVESQLDLTIPDVPRHFVDHRSEIPEEHQNQYTLFVKRPDGPVVGRCPGTRGHVCCNYLTVDLYVGCNLGCSYCIMKSYLNFSPLTVHVGLDEAIAEVRRIARKNADRSVRVGSGETGDSLLLDPIFESSRTLIEELASEPNLALELKTKTDLVDHLLDIPMKGRTVIGFSLNPPEVSVPEEGASAPVARRLEAARRVVASGYRVAFHFDPIMAVPGWREHYEALIRELGAFPADRVAWISLGTIRYTPALREKIGDRPYLLDEFVPGTDGKYRYPQKERVAVYRWFRRRLAELLPAPTYMCMESAAVWRRSFGALPRELPELEPIFSPVRL